MVGGIEGVHVVGMGGPVPVTVAPFLGGQFLQSVEQSSYGGYISPLDEKYLYSGATTSTFTRSGDSKYAA